MKNKNLIIETITWIIPFLDVKTMNIHQKMVILIKKTMKLYSKTMILLLKDYENILKCDFLIPPPPH